MALTPKQKKLPPALQRAILAKQKQKGMHVGKKKKPMKKNGKKRGKKRSSRG